MHKSNVFLILLVFLAFASFTWAEVPTRINYQGILTDKDTGEPLTGILTINFTICDAETDDLCPWSESQDVECDDNGMFNVQLGANTPLDPGLFDNPDLWLSVSVGGEELLPRTKFTSVPYAFNGGGWIDEGSTVKLVTTSDNVAIGTDVATSKITVHGSGTDKAGYFQARGQHALTAYNNVPAGMANTYGIYGRAAGGDGDVHGVYGLADGSSGDGIGVLGSAHSNSNYSIGVRGRADSESGAANYHVGVQANAVHGAVENTGVYANAGGTGATNYGVYATATGGATNYAGYFDGDVHITGSLTGVSASPSTPIIWSGGSTSHGTGSTDWITYGSDGVDFNTATGYISTDGSGVFTVQTAGFYRINVWMIWLSTSVYNSQIVKNDVSIHFVQQIGTGGWLDVSMDVTWQFDEGDQFWVRCNETTGAGYAFHAWNAQGQHSRLQITYVGPPAP